VRAGPKRGPTFDHSALRLLLAEAADMGEVDPRTLHASQNWIVRAHVAYYLTGEWEHAGRTSADRDIELSRFPVVVQDAASRSVIVAGHHRARRRPAHGSTASCSDAADLDADPCC
jgi:hypothetical protein